MDEQKLDPQKYQKAKDAIYHYQTGSGYHPGDFALALVKAVMIADADNLAKFRMVFPEMVQAVLDDRKVWKKNQPPEN